MRTGFAGSLSRLMVSIRPGPSKVWSVCERPATTNTEFT
ncbi:Uncharacterised protein [Mycobacteroides abscessus subsp. abscessus]|nr:Uncharacterised protein [Mycobacteroides abscessus subsp. abscessus]